MPGKCSFQDIWLQKPEFKDWLVKVKEDTVEPWFNNLRYNDILGITIHIRLPGKSYSKMYGAEPRFNDLRFNDIPGLTMMTERKIFPVITIK